MLEFGVNTWRFPYSDQKSSVWNCRLLTEFQLGGERGLERMDVDGESELKELFDSEIAGIISSNSSSSFDEELLGDESSRKIFVGRVPRDISESKMFDFFSQFGTVEQLELNLERGCCFVTFKDSGSIDTILESQNVRYLEFEGCEMCIRKYVVVEKDKIFVRGIPSKTSKEDIFNYFKQFGKIAHVNLHLNKNGAQCFAFVRFARPKSVNQIMARNDHVILGKNVHCLRAHKQDGASALEAGAASDDQQKAKPKSLTKKCGK